MDESLLEMVVLGLAVFITAICVYGILEPRQLAATAARLWAKPWSMALAVALRLLLGVCLLLTADASRVRLVYLLVGWASIAAAVILPLAGRRWIGRVLDWSNKLPPMAMRAWCLVGAAFGLLIGYGVMPMQLL